MMQVIHNPLIQLPVNQRRYEKVSGASTSNSWWKEHQFQQHRSQILCPHQSKQRWRQAVMREESGDNKKQEGGRGGQFREEDKQQFSKQAAGRVIKRWVVGEHAIRMHKW